MLSRIHLYLFLMPLFYLFVTGTPAHAQYIPKDEVLISGQTVSLSVPQAGKLSIVSHPGSAVSRKMEIAIHSSSYEWTPERAGIYVLSTPGGPSQTVSVRFSSFPIPGFIVLIIAFIVLFGGAAFTSYNVFTSK
jgi:hypothetical protein